MKLRKLFIALFLLLFFLSCRDNAVEFTAEAKNGNIYIDSNPKGADIYFNGIDTEKNTPDSLINVQPGSYLVGVLLLGVGQQSSFVIVKSGEKKYVNFFIR